MIKIYGMKTCPDCTFVDEQVKGNDRYEEIIILCLMMPKNMAMQVFPALF